MVRLGLALRHRLLDILERKLQLIGVELLGTAAELRPLQLAQKMPQPIVLIADPVPLGQGAIAFGSQSVAFGR